MKRTSRRGESRISPIAKESSSATTAEARATSRVVTTPLNNTGSRSKGCGSFSARPPPPRPPALRPPALRRPAPRSGRAKLLRRHGDRGQLIRREAEGLQDREQLAVGEHLA